MATSNVSRTCLKCLRATSPASTNSRVFQKSFRTATPLFLDFLAPSWQPQRSKIQPATHSSNRNAPQAQTNRLFSQGVRQRALAIQNPRTDDNGNDMFINITPRAAHRLQAIAETDSNPDLALRVSVESGGCHGFQYLMSLTTTAEADPEEDTVFENEERVNNKGGGEGEGYKAKVIMDEPSLELLKGSSVDYTMELIGSQFKVTGIPGAKSSCGCGTSFDIAT